MWTWDISYCPSTVIGRFFYLYMIIDIFSRKIVGGKSMKVSLGSMQLNCLRAAFGRRSA
ncbi:hypothetical protein [Alteromonas lipotrueae]|uniref:hypothetical protein n=1 Tax=Alteromonas lipotrueae TaxID=2803814 RepID=UPI0035A5C876